MSEIFEREEEYGNSLGRVNNTGYNGTQWVALRADQSTRSLQTIEYEHHEIHDGSAFHNHMWADVSANDVLDIRLVTPDTDKHLHIGYQFDAEGEFHVTFLKNIAIVNTGTALSSINHDHNSGKTSGMVAFDYVTNVSVAAANTDTNTSVASVAFKMVLGSGKQIGGDTDHSAEQILKRDEGYCIRFENQSPATKYVNWSFHWYEHTPKDA